MSEADYVRAERVRFVFTQAILPTLFSPIAGGIMALALWDTVTHDALTDFVIGLVGLALMRVALVRTYPRLALTPARVRRWELTFVLSIVAVDLWWGIGAPLLAPAALQSRMLIFAFLMLMAGGHSASYAAHPPTVIAGALALTGPITVMFAMQQDIHLRTMAVAAVMYLMATFRSVRSLSYFFGHAHQLTFALQQEKDRAEKLARTDALTELNNRRAFFELGNAALAQADRYEHPASLMMLDIDHFKRVNDTFGHATGDQVLRELAGVITKQQRHTDICARIGGEEFAVLLVETAAPEAAQIAERLRAAVDTPDRAIVFTVSVGVTSARDKETLEQLLARADKALYAAKGAGRNRVHIN